MIYNVLQDDNNNPYIQMVEPFTGVCFQLGAVRFVGTDEDPILEYNYEIIDGADMIDDVKKFEEFAANLLLDLIDKRLKEGNLLFTGGT